MRNESKIRNLCVGTLLFAALSGPAFSGDGCGGGTCDKAKAVAADGCKEGKAVATSAGAGACEGKTVAICEKKASALAASIRSEGCRDKSLAILASALPEIGCEKSRSKILDEVKGKASDADASSVVLAAFKTASASWRASGGACGASKGTQAAAAGCPSKAVETAAKPGCCSASKQTTVAASPGSCEGASAAKGGCGDKDVARLCAIVARTVAVQVRSEACPTRSAGILQAALPGVGCKEAIAKLVAEVKSKDCDVEAAEVILAAAAPKKGAGDVARQ
jgi:hypothetical protein